MRHEQVPAEVVELARQHGIDVQRLASELTDADLEAVVGGGQKEGSFFSGGGVTSGRFRKS
jgi:hypothetical protein